MPLVAKALLAAWAAKHGGAAANVAGLALALSWSIGEGAWTQYLIGTNNFGSIHATRGFASSFGQTSGYGMLAFLDHGGSGAYITRFAVYPSLAIGARAFLDLVEKDVDLSTAQTPADFATGFYVHGYYEGFHTPVTPVGGRAAALAGNTWTDGDRANLADGAALVAAHLPAAQAAFAGVDAEPGDPTDVSVGPPFAPLADRLTPAGTYAPHTLEHARALLGANADNPPPGAISIADALAAPGGDGVWLFGPGGIPPAPATLPTSPEPSGQGIAAIAATAVVVTLTSLLVTTAWNTIGRRVRAPA